MVPSSLQFYIRRITLFTQMLYSLSDGETDSCQVRCRDGGASFSRNIRPYGGAVCRWRMHLQLSLGVHISHLPRGRSFRLLFRTRSKVNGLFYFINYFFSTAVYSPLGLDISLLLVNKPALPYVATFRYPTMHHSFSFTFPRRPIRRSNLFILGVQPSLWNPNPFLICPDLAF